jgi:hypothetical protein
VSEPNPIVGAVTGALAGAGTVSAANSALASSGGFSSIASTLSFPGTWKRIGLGAAGVWLCYLGVVIILSQTSVVKSALGAATSVVTKGVVK